MIGSVFSRNGIHGRQKLFAPLIMLLNTVHPILVRNLSLRTNPFGKVKGEEDIGFGKHI